VDGDESVPGLRGLVLSTATTADPSARSRQRLTTSSLFAYGISDFPVTLAGMPLMLYLNVYYATEVGIGLVELGNLLLFARIFDLATDPLVGYLSDHTRTRWGRRKPWMIASLPFMMLGLYRVLIPTEGAGLGYVFTWMMVMWLGWTMLMIPYYAWGAELTTDYDERTRVTGWRAAMGSLGQLTAITFPVVAAVWFSLDGISGIMHLTAYAAMILIPIAVLFTVTRVKEVPDLNAPAMQVFDGLKVMLRNGSFRWLVVAFMLSSLGLAVLMPLNAFYALSVLEAAQNEVPILMFFGSIAGLAGIPFWVAVSRRYGKHRAWIGGFMVVTAFSPMYLFLGPGDFWFMVPFAALSAFGTGSFVALPNSMKADVIDIDTARTGENRAAMFFSAWSLATKFAGSLGGSLGLWALAWAGFDAQLGQENSAAAITGLKYIYVFLPSSIFIIAGLVIWNYPLGKERQQRIRAAIDRRDARRARRLESGLR
jgi:Na+/melibiose symporter-like transporter